MISEKSIRRMEGLTNLSAQTDLIQSVDTIYTDLKEDGFEREEILEYLTSIIRGACAAQ